VIDRLEVLHRAGISDERRKRIHANRYGVIAREGTHPPRPRCARFSTERRHATLCAFVIERQASLTDLAIDLFANCWAAPAQGGTEPQERLLQEAQILNGIAVDHVRLGQAAGGAPNGIDMATAIGEALMGRTGSEHHGRLPDRRPDRHDEFDDLIDRHRSLRALARPIFAAFDFRSFRPTDQILASIQLLRGCMRVVGCPDGAALLSHAQMASSRPLG
jgi:hypothetical protein